MDHQEIVRQFAACIVCSQQVCRHFAPRLGIDISSPEGMARACAQGVFSTVCAPLVARTCALLESGWDRS